MEDFFEELGIPAKYIQATPKENLYIVLVNKNWLKSLVIDGKLGDFIEVSFETWPTTTEELDPSWLKIFVRVFKKRNVNVIPLPRIRTPIRSNEPPLFFCQLLQYISQTNYKYLWKEAFKKYTTTKSDLNKETTSVTLVDYNTVLREIIQRTYNCPFVNTCDERIRTKNDEDAVNLNVLPAICCVETLNGLFLLQSPYFEHNLKDCVTFSPAILNQCYTKPLFIVYQLLQTLKSMHDHSLTLGDITLSDVYMTADMWIYLLPAIQSNIYVQETKPLCYDLKPSFCYDQVQVSETSTLTELCQLWIDGQISNFTYISALNRLSGRKSNDPNCHHVFPWVTDFSSPCGKHWRDLKKSKYRLNKGDRQLDLTFESSQVPHHVSDVLSSITYYVYMARKTPKSVLCKNVRTNWVPAEYPSSIQRLQEWTPDECIPEFFTDAGVFRSIHDDLDDLEIPTWCQSPEDFIVKHRQLLESGHVSERLHHWIDLTFGYKLAGSPAVRAKNVCLSLVDGHVALTKSGIVQLFTHPHPQKTLQSVFWSKTPPKNFTQPKRDRSSSPAVNVKSDDEDLTLSKFLSRSRSSLNEEPVPKVTKRSTSLGPKSTFQSHVKKGLTLATVINLPKEYKPELALELLEKKHLFFLQTFHCDHLTKIDTIKPITNVESNYMQNSFTNMIYSDDFATNFRWKKQSNNSQNKVVCNYSDIISSRRIRELQVLGCLIVEIFLAKQLRVLDATDQSFEVRLKSCRTIVKNCQVPSCIRKIVDVLLQPDLQGDFCYPSVSSAGLPPPSAHLLLEPLMHLTLPFPKLFPKLYRLIGSLKEYQSVYAELNLFVDDDGERLKLEENIGECVVKNCVRQLDDLLLDVNPSTDCEIVNILAVHIKQLIKQPKTSVLAAWYLFDPIAKVLGGEQSVVFLMEPILQLYENETSSPYTNKVAKLYHHSFLLRLIVRFGLKIFLDNFIVPLVEAVGRYKDHPRPELTIKPSNLKNMEPIEVRIVTEPQMFDFDDEQTVVEPESETDWGLDATISENLDQLRSLEELNLNLSEDECKVASPTIPIPCKSSDLMNISCTIGSKSDSFDARSLIEEQNEVRKPRKVLKDTKNVKISDLSSESLIWLSLRLGPVLTARYLSRNLLKMLTLCYVGRENMVACLNDDFLSVASSYVIGDRNASKVLECLTSIAGLYGEQFILFQYIPHMSELIALCKRKLTLNLEGGLISCLALLQHAIPYLSDLTLMDHLQDVILKSILHPILRLLSSTRYLFPSGHTARNILSRKYIDCLYVLSIRMGSDMTRTHLAVPSLQRFFLIFDKLTTTATDSTLSEDNQTAESDDSHYVEINRDGTFTDWTIGGRPLTIFTAPRSSSTPPPSEDTYNLAMEELRGAFTPDLAHASYLPFLKHIGADSLEISLKNHALIRDLCQEYESECKQSPRSQIGDVSSRSETITASSSIGSNIALIGNRIDLQVDNLNSDLLSLVSNRMESNNRHLRGNWLAYWEHEIGRSDKDTTFNFKQIKLQTFAGHTHSVKCLHVLDNENSFMSGGRDKTVKLWSLRSHGDGQSVSNCQWTYTAHKKSVRSLTFIESSRLVASCDTIVHIWDPFMGANVGHLESAKYAPVNVLRSLPAPASLFLAATSDGTVKVVDCRTCSYIHEWKLSSSAGGLIRCLAVSPNGAWCAAGQSSGTITVLDTRTGLVMAAWRAHEGEVLQIVAFDNNTLISTSFDQTISVSNVNDGRQSVNLRGVTEPVHCLNVFNAELISGTTANRIGVHTGIHLEASFSSTKLRSDAFKGFLTSMALLPLNRLLLLGADNGAVSLLC